MPRLFTSHRLPPQPLLTQHRLGNRNRVPTDAVDIAMPSPSPPLQSVALPRPQYDHAGVKPQVVAGETPPFVLVPPVPKFLLKLMDSHDIDNPYLMASFNVLIDNNNNPMRVPDILQAVTRKGWTQVLHKHKDRPEQLFGNALRSHQRRRENLGQPSLVFMIDAGACWKHHELDLSAASGRKKGKIWCFSLDAGFPCPYTRLGLDLEMVRRCQHGPGEEEGAIARKEARPRDDSDADDEDGPSNASARGAPRKKRKVVASPPPPQVSLTKLDGYLPDRFEPHTLAVRGNVASAHSVASSLEPPPYVPAALISIPPHNPNTPTPKSRINHHGTRSTRSTTITKGATTARARYTEAPVSRTRGQLRKALVSEAELELDLEGLDGLEAMTPEPEAMGDAEDGELAEDDGADEDGAVAFASAYGALLPFFSIPSDIDPSRARSLSLAFETAYIPESDDDEDDFHVTMQEFSDDEDMTPIKHEDDAFPPSFLLGSATSPFDDFESSDSGASIARTPTPGLQGSGTSGLVVDHSSWDTFDSDGPFHSFSMGVHEPPNWDPERVVVLKNEMVNQGWSRAPSPEFHEHANRLMRPSPLSLDSMELDTAPHSPAGSAADGSEMSTGEGSAFSSTRSSVSGASTGFSMGPATPLTELLDPLSRRSSVVSSPSSFLAPHHPLILYSPSLSPTVDAERPLKCGLAHRYIYPSEDAAQVDDMLESREVKELVGLVNFGEIADCTAIGPDESPILSNIVPPTPAKYLPWPPSPLSLQPIESPSPVPMHGW